MIQKAKEQCGSLVANDAAHYKTLMQNLIVQGFIKLYETQVIVRVRAVDVAMVKGILNDALVDYKRIMLQEAKDHVEIESMVDENEKNFLPANGYVFTEHILHILVSYSGYNIRPGGVIMIAHQGKIVCDNTLITYVLTLPFCMLISLSFNFRRLNYVNYDLKPKIRSMLFPTLK